MTSTVMKPQTFKAVRLFISTVALAMTFALSVSAQTTTFAQFFQSVGGNNFVFTNNTTSGSFDSISGGVPVFLIYQNVAGLDPSLQGPQAAKLTISTVTNSPGSVSGATLTQPLNQTITIQIIRDTPAPPGVGILSRNALLTVVITPAGQTPALTGTTAATSASFSVATPSHNVTFASHFLNFSSTTARDMALSFSSVTPGLALGAGSFLQSSAMSGSGTFASNPVPTILTNPTAASVSLGGRVYGPNGAPLRNVEVMMSEQNGTTRVARTSAFGYYQFDDVEAGQGVILSVRTKRYQFQPQLVSVTDSAFDVNFTPAN